ncbi:methyltransferase domain-containing protein [Abortiporus biennis]|nr:methyltransferase domain-containing protein [Abortiporus biennis]
MALPTVVARNPRYSALLAVVLLTVIFFVYPSHPHYGGLSMSLRGPRPLHEILREEELRYNRVLKGREGMVKKWGPTADLVKSFPPKDDFYTLWDFFIPGFNCPHHVERIGTMGDGGKWVCGMDRIARQKDCVIYSFGVNGESSFESELLERAPGCQIWGYDFSVNSFGPEIEQVPSLKSRSHFFPYALSAKDNHAPGVHPPEYTLQTLMEINGHDFIDILKVDIEGAEFESLISFIEASAASTSSRTHPHSHPHGGRGGSGRNGGSLPVGQLQIEIHAWEGSPHGEFAPFKTWWERLEAAGLRPFWTEPNLVYVNLIRGVRPQLSEYSFMNIRGDHALVSDHHDFHKP